MLNDSAKLVISNAGGKYWRLGMSRGRWIRILERSGIEDDAVKAGIIGYDKARESWMDRMWAGWLNG